MRWAADGSRTQHARRDLRSLHAATLAMAVHDINYNTVIHKDYIACLSVLRL